ncbi:MAG: hypothetical protein SGI71_12335 [Verrucomicrobiota bacterium]|nr:hypothetical protein [Verrucomicrobiota bacterium]
MKLNSPIPPFAVVLNHFNGTTPNVRHVVDISGGGRGQFVDDKNNSWNWTLSVKPTHCNGHEGSVIEVSLTLEKGSADAVNLSVEFTENAWSTENFVLVPGAVYNGNRYTSRRIMYPPMLTEPSEIGPDVPCIISDIPRLNINPGLSRFHLISGDASIPALGFFSPEQKKQQWIMINQESGFGDHGLWLEESDDRKRATLAVETPGVRRGQSFSLMSMMRESRDVAAKVEPGQTLSIKVMVFGGKADHVQDLFDTLVDLRNVATPEPKLRKELPFSKAWEIQERKFNLHNFQLDKIFAGTGDPHMAAWQPGWTGHGMVTQTFLSEGTSLSKERAKTTLDFCFIEALAPSGYFYGFYTKNRGFFGDHFAHQDWPWHLLRKSADMLYFGFRQFDVLKKQNPDWKCPLEWEKGIRRLADAFVKTWDRYGQLGQFVNHDTGEILVGGSTSGSTAPAGLALASIWFKEARYLEVAEAIARKYCQEDLASGVTTGGPGEILQAADSESVGNLLESLVVLYEVTGREEWLKQAQIAGAQLNSWFVSYDYTFPPQSTYGKLDMLTTGTLYASTQNKCAVPGLCTLSGDALLKLFRATGEEHWLRLLRELTHALPQFLSREDKVIAGMPEGFMSERVQMGDGIDPCGEICACSCWSEVCLIFAWMEVPGIYIQTDTGILSVNDHVKAEILSQDKDVMVVAITNPTSFEATVKILAETKSESRVLLGQNWSTRMVKVTIPAGESKSIMIVGGQIENHLSN